MHPINKFNFRVNNDKFTFEISYIKTYKSTHIYKNI